MPAAALQWIVTGGALQTDAGIDDRLMSALERGADDRSEVLPATADPGELQSWFLAKHLVDTPLVRLANGKHGNSN